MQHFFTRKLPGLSAGPLVSMAVAAVLLSACVRQDASPAGQSDEARPAATVYAAYSLLAPADDGATLIYARVIQAGVHTEDGLCPVLEGDDGSRVATRVRGMHPDTGNFPVTLCEAKIAAGIGYHSAGGDIKLAAVTLGAKHVLVYGDSGCKSEVCAAGTAAEPFATLAQQGLKLQAQGGQGSLILHMGDYNYRGTGGSIANGIYAYDAGDDDYGGPSCGLDETYYSQNAAGSPKPDNWQTWYEDFFLPAKELLASAPWVFARGNHELCSRAGPGWFYFLGPGSALPGGIAQQSCPAQGQFDSPPPKAVGHIKLLPPYRLSLDKLQLWVLDSANACDDRSANALTAQYQAQFEQLQQAAAALPDEPIWLMTHRPLWGVSGPSQTLNKMLQTALAQTPTGQLPPQLALSLSGHMHSYQSLSFAATAQRPPQLVVGNSGVSLSSTQANQDFAVQIDGQEAQGNAQGKFGFLSIETGPDKAWQARMLDTQGKAFIRCDSTNAAEGGRICE
ncbi:metallophosphoesterase [Shewanella sp. AS16]|uniref:metallophosphoesterase n=1 Tax=Shewanella sp. AS16 TaxID=2907625 RepID=UPI001F270D85|nr:metallophosphoesterase [Shewanella sp. AS16]MCE9686439.1 metallophosphoesterase [Shewanella sp. AS16]